MENKNPKSGSDDQHPDNRAHSKEASGDDHQARVLHDPHGRHISDIDRREGELDHGETGGNFKENARESRH